MQISPVNFSSYKQSVNKEHSKNLNVNFKQSCPLTKIGELKTESGQKIYSRIQKYLRLIGCEGMVNNVTLIKDNETSIILTIDKKAKKTKLIIEENNGSNNTLNTFNALFDEQGRMINAELNNGNIMFERYGNNVRRLKKREGGIFRLYLPVGGYDKLWEYSGKSLRLDTDMVKGRYTSGMSEIFLELTRLGTSLFK